MHIRLKRVQISDLCKIVTATEQYLKTFYRIQEKKINRKWHY